MNVCPKEPVPPVTSMEEFLNMHICPTRWILCF